MKSKLFLKLGLLLTFVTIAFFSIIIFIISPKIIKHLKDSELQNASVKLERVASLIEMRSKNIQDYELHALENHKKIIKNIAKTAYIVLNEAYLNYKNKTITRQEAVDFAFKTISKIEYGFDKDYIYLLDLKGNVLLHPDKRFYKKNIYYTADYNGKLFINDIVEQSVKHGETFTQYTWPRANSNYVSEKVSYSLYFEPFDMIITTGIYLDDIKNDVIKQKNKFISNLKEFLKTEVLGKTGYIYILTHENMMLIHPNEELVGKDVSLYIEPQSKTYMVDNIKTASKNNESLSYYWDKPNDKGHFVYKKIANIKYNEYYKWYIVSSVYEEDFVQSAIELKNIILNISIIVFILLFIVGLYFVKKILDPIKELSKNTLKVNSGDFSFRNDIQSNDEIGELAKQFNFMLDTIEHNISNLEKGIELRTKEIEFKLYFDELTHLKNRYSLLEDIKKDEFTTLIIIDVHSFDDINELYGFTIGNQVLVSISELLKNFSKKYEDTTLYRVYGNSFVLRHTKMIYNMEQLENVIDGLNHLFKTTPIRIKEIHTDINISINMGISICQNEPIKTANTALKKAKECNKNFYIYNSDINPKKNIEETLYWKNKIKEAISNNNVVPFYQPIVNTDEEIVKYEALMRIKDQKEGETIYITPNFFLDIASKTKQYHELSDIMIEKALIQLTKTDKMISVNIGFENIQNLEFIELIDRLLHNKNEAFCSRLIFEILESDMISDYDILNNFIIKYREKGVKIAIDDFGTGYSNFKNILLMRPDYLKIDASLIKDIDNNEDSFQLVKSIVEFSKALDIKLIAEFVYSKEVFEITKSLGIDEFQGYYFGKPNYKI